MESGEMPFRTWYDEIGLAPELLFFRDVFSSSTKINGMKKGILFILFPLFAFTAYSQRYIWAPDSFSVGNPNYGMDRYHDILRYHDPIMYLAFPIIQPILDRPIDLEDGEGKNGYWLENHFGYRFAIYQGKYYSSPF